VSLSKTDFFYSRGDEGLKGMESFTDADFKRAMWSALRLLTVVTVVGFPLVWWKMAGRRRGRWEWCWRGSFCG
jgi:hypothetical protein